SALELYNLLTGSFLCEKAYRGHFINLSVSGARICIEENQYYDTFSSVVNMSLLLRIIGVADIAVSGTLTYIQKAKMGFFLGVKFERSVFGQRFPKFLNETIQTHNLRRD
ncbi:MAG: hypothetical protein ACOCWH_05885, partial [Spirochaetota bacterium]